MAISLLFCVENLNYLYITTAVYISIGVFQAGRVSQTETNPPSIFTYNECRAPNGHCKDSASRGRFIRE